MAIVWVECWKCELCGHRWIKTGDAPRLCSKCKKTGWNKIGGDSSVVEQRKTAGHRNLLPNPQDSGSSPDLRSKVAQCLSAIDDGAKGPNNASTARPKMTIADLRSYCEGNVPQVEVDPEPEEDVTPECCECGHGMVGKEIKGRGVVWACVGTGCPMYGREQK